MKRGFNWKEFGRFCLYLFVIAGFLTSNLLLFLHSSDLKFTEENISGSGLVTMLNVVGLTVIIWLIDRLRRRNMIDRPVVKIQEGIDRITAGDFSARIDPKGVGNAYQYGRIIDGINGMAKELGSVETLKTDFISNVSHEIKTPISVIRNYSQLLEADTLSDADRREYARVVSDASLRLSELITNILKLNRLENQQLTLRRERFDLSAQLTECLLGFETVWTEKSIDIAPNIEDGVTVSSDPELLPLVWNNLLSNAFKFTEPGGTVSVSLKAEGGFAVVSIGDTGCGISPEASRHIFDKFYQGDTSHATQGNGLGLALVKRVVDIVGGTVTVDSEAGKGSTFTVRLRMEP